MKKVIGFSAVVFGIIINIVWISLLFSANYNYMTSSPVYYQEIDYFSPFISLLVIFISLSLIAYGIVELLYQDNIEEKEQFCPHCGKKLNNGN